MTISQLRRSVPMLSWTLYLLSKRAKRRCLFVGYWRKCCLRCQYYCRSWPRDRGILWAQWVCWVEGRWGGIVWNSVRIRCRNSVDKTFCQFGSANLLLWTLLWGYCWCLDSMKTFWEGLCPSSWMPVVKRLWSHFPWSLASLNSTFWTNHIYMALVTSESHSFWFMQVHLVCSYPLNVSPETLLSWSPVSYPDYSRPPLCISASAATHTLASPVNTHAALRI